MFKRRVEDSGVTTIFRFACRLFYAHVMNVLIMLVVYVLVDNLNLIGIDPPGGLYAVCVTVACMIFYLVYVYIQSWRIGQRDNNLELYHHITYNKWKPLAAAAASQIPGIVLSFLVQLPDVGEAFRGPASIFYVNFSWFLARFYTGFRPIYFVPVLLPLVLAPVAYHMGHKGIFLADKVVYNVPKEQSDRNKER